MWVGGWVGICKWVVGRRCGWQPDEETEEKTKSLFGLARLPKDENEDQAYFLSVGEGWRGRPEAKTGHELCQRAKSGGSYLVSMHKQVLTSRTE